MSRSVFDQEMKKFREEMAELKAGMAKLIAENRELKTSIDCYETKGVSFFFHIFLYTFIFVHSTLFFSSFVTGTGECRKVQPYCSIAKDDCGVDFGIRTSCFSLLFGLDSRRTNLCRLQLEDTS